ncbi:hypothetical protein ACQ4PT_029144 [Festuca glaucescens]
MNRRDSLKNTMGFDKDVVTLEEMLLHKDHRQLMFISILGESGVGKRTLARIIWHQMKETTKHFTIPVWYSMPPDSTKEVLLQEIYSRAHRRTETQDQPEEGPSDIANMLRHLLADKKYLVILSGISSKTMLNCLRASLPDDSNGSRVVLILDTESEEVAWHANTMNLPYISGIHMLSRLDEGGSGQLFCSRAFRKDELSDKKNSKSKYDKIVYDITGGHPLAIVVLAGLLRFKEKPGQWEAVLQQLRPCSGTEEGQDDEDNQITGAVLSQEKRIDSKMSPTTQAKLSTRTTIERVFWASFEDLPNDLKSCFLYFATFSKDTFLFADSVVRMWIAEGFIKPQKGKTMEQLGHNYLKELVLRCLVQIISISDAGGIEKVSVHRSLHGFLQSEVREAGFVEVHDMHYVFVPPSVRRLSFQSFDGRYGIFSNKLSKLRSFICCVTTAQNSSGNTDVDKEKENNDVNKEKDWHDIKFLHVSKFRRILGGRCRSKFLRVISIDGLRLQKLPNEIGDLIHLRYLLVHSEHLKDLPSRITRLLNLQTLDIRTTKVEKIDPGFWKITALRHILAEELTLPVSIKEELDELQTLHGVKPAKGQKWDGFSCPLHKMTKLRSMELHGFKDSEHGAELESALINMHLLGHLKLLGDVFPSCVFTGESLQYLQTADLEVEGNVQWPSFDKFEHLHRVRPNLVHLKLRITNDAPEDIKEAASRKDIQEKLTKVGFNRSQFAPVCKFSYKWTKAKEAPAKQVDQGEASSSKTEQ